MKIAVMLVAALVLLGGFGLAASAQQQGPSTGPAGPGPAANASDTSNVCPNPNCPGGGMGRGYCGGRGTGGGMGRGAQMGGRGWRMGPQDGTGPRRDGSCIKS